MKIRIDDSCFDLRSRQIMRFDGATGVAIVCLRGELWLTQDGDPRDLMLAAGDRFTLDRDGIALIEALEPSSVRVEMACAPSAARARGDARVWMALAGWLAPATPPLRRASLPR